MDTYEKKYKDANNKVAARFGTNVAKEIFTDLYESEDERMMHQLHSWMKEFGGAEEYTEKVYTWLKSLLEKQAQTFTKRDVDEAFVEGMAFAKNELEKQGKQKTSLSEEDERIRKAILELVRQSSEVLDRQNQNNMIAWLKKQGEPTDNDMVEALRTEYEKGKADVIAEMQKEWSKEDENHVISLLERLEGLCRNEFERTRFAINEDQDWLKSLKQRYTWTPSDEQMEALYEETQKSDRIIDDRIVSLYNDLKKLKGE